jgi:molecular chaperone GrpE
MAFNFNFKKKMTDSQTPQNEQAGTAEATATQTTNAQDANAQAAETANPLEQQVADLQKEVAAYKSQLLYKEADVQNYRRKKDEEVERIRANASEKIVVELLPLLDDFERTLKFSDKVLEESGSKPNTTNFIGGVRLVQSKFLKVLEARGVKKIEAVGKKFDVNFHEALVEMEKEGVPAGTIVEEYEAGYTMNDRVIRYCRVVVAK